jgi:hypothetical protein
MWPDRHCGHRLDFIEDFASLSLDICHLRSAAAQTGASGTVVYARPQVGGKTHFGVVKDFFLCFLVSSCSGESDDQTNAD